MAADEDKARDLIDKLLRLAAPTSGTTEEERSSAALEAARLIQEHGVTFTKAAEPPAREVRTISPHAWVLSVALHPCGCTFCQKLISRGDIVWVRVAPSLYVEHRHNADPCRKSL